MTPREALIAEGVDAQTVDKFLAWHKQRPEVWKAFESCALELVHRGVKRYGAKAIAEIVRYHRLMETAKDDFVLNNNFVAYYARIWALKYPHHKEFFEFRDVKGLRSALV
jgi:hypothetical protein